MRKIIGYSLLGCLFLFLLAAAGKSYGQGGAEGTILGTVTDSSGAVVPKAGVEVTNVGTGVTQSTITNDSGEYSVPSLHPDQYHVAVKMSGFEASVATITLLVGQHARVDVTLQPGKVSDVVNVTTSNTSLDTDTAEISQTISSQQVEDLPLNSRNFVSLLFLNSNTVMTGGESGGNNINSAKGNGAISIGGGRSSSNQYLIDGMYNNDSVYQTPAISPSIDAIQEFKTQSGVYSAEYGARIRKATAALNAQNWDARYGLYADTPAKKSYSIEANVLAVWLDVAPGAQQAAMMRRLLASKPGAETILEDRPVPAMSPPTYYFRFYLSRALEHAGMADLYLQQLQPWYDMLRLGLSTWAENPEPTRSDCHAWSSSPNYDLLTLVAGIQPDVPGFKGVRIVPHLRGLHHLDASMPHVGGEIHTVYQLEGASWKVTVTLPAGMNGELVWGTHEYPLHVATQVLRLAGDEK